MKVRIIEYSDSFAENKDVAKHLRESFIFPAYRDPAEEIVISFDGIDSSTQSFIHALISDLFQRHGEAVLDRIAFQNCSPAIKSLIATVINYSLE